MFGVNTAAGAPNPALVAEQAAVHSCTARGGAVALRGDETRPSPPGAVFRRAGEELGFLQHLMTRPEKMIFTEELLEHVWYTHADYFAETVRTTLSTLHHKLSGD
ncbi:hypothetical protein FRAHR75_300016 [Frankia sp. Hr75.2]|nr:hypothetical protein FRAHR75_300016 [Frankia sp. Hr75.2]